MTSESLPDAFRLESGRWVGYYEQWGQRFQQDHRMEFADGLVRGDGADELGPFRLEGCYRNGADGVRLGWIETYEGAHSILYLGILRGDWIEGTWRVEGPDHEADTHGRFAMIPQHLAPNEPPQ